MRASEPLHFSLSNAVPRSEAELGRNAAPVTSSIHDRSLSDFHGRQSPFVDRDRRRDVFGCHVNLFVSTFGDRAKNGRKTGVGWAIGPNNLTSWSQLTPSLCWVGAIFVLLTALATRNGQRRLQKRTAQQNRASPMAFEDIALLPYWYCRDFYA